MTGVQTCALPILNPIPVKTAMNLLDLEAGDLRLPLCEPDEAVTARIRRTLVQYGLATSC